MDNTPNSNRKHIAIFGKTNSGKSLLLNSIIGQDISLVSPVKGTTTDPVKKAMELIPLGPVLFIDTAGLDDSGEIGELRVKRSLKILQNTDFAIYLMDINDMDKKSYNKAVVNFKKYNIPHILVINKIDIASNKDIKYAKDNFKDAIFVSAKDKTNILNLKDEIIKQLKQKESDPPIVGDLIPYNGKVILVIPIDSEAPKGRLILPQVQVIRDCLDHGIKSYVVRDTELEYAINDINNIDLVITDSRIFKKVNKIVPLNIKLTSFSILFARYKGELEVFLKGVSKIEKLDKNSKILITESCAHNHSHEDIGRIKIPKMLNNHVGKELNYDFKMGQYFPDDIEKYDLIIHCGACMLNKKAMQTRIEMCNKKNVNIINYGIILAYLTGILDRSLEIFN